MQLRPTITALLFITSASCSPPSAQVRGGYHFFNDATVEISSPRVDAQVELEEVVTLSPYWSADVITAATPIMNGPDTVTRATEFVETRHEAGVGVLWEVSPSLRVNSSYALSTESDYLSHSGGVGVAVEVLDRNATIATNARVSFDEIGRSDAPDFSAAMSILGGDLTWSHIITPEIVLSGVYSIEHRNGFQANPYRYVPIYAPGEARPLLTLPELLPEHRTRHAIEALGVFYFNPDLFLHASYRFYADDWMLLSHALSTELWSALFDDALRLRARLRAYNQSGAEFYSSRYESATTTRTGDYRLSPMWTLSAGLRVDARTEPLSSPWNAQLSVTGDLLSFHFEDFPVRDQMLGWIVGASLSLESP